MAEHVTLSAGVVVVREVDAQWRYLLLRVYNYWDFPKGIVEPGEDALAGAIRETKEETTLADLQFNWGRVYRETEPYNQGRKIARYYVASTQSENVELPVSAELGRPEHDEFRWVTYHEGAQLLLPRVKAILDWARELLDKEASLR